MTTKGKGGVQNTQKIVHVVYGWPLEKMNHMFAIAVYVHKFLNTSSNAPLKIFEIPVLLWNEFWIVLRMIDGNVKDTNRKIRKNGFIYICGF